MLKKERGITLVALVITIIVLLILAGVSISLVVGNNGVLTQASGAVVTNNVAGMREKVDNALAALETKYWSQWANDSSITRASIYDATNALKNEIESNIGGDYVATISGSVCGTGVCTIQINKTGATETYKFTLKPAVDANTGKYTLYYGIIPTPPEGEDPDESKISLKDASLAYEK